MIIFWRIIYNKVIFNIIIFLTLILGEIVENIIRVFMRFRKRRLNAEISHEWTIIANGVIYISQIFIFSQKWGFINMFFINFSRFFIFQNFWAFLLNLVFKIRKFFLGAPIFNIYVSIFFIAIFLIFVIIICFLINYNLFAFMALFWIDINF